MQEELTQEEYNKLVRVIGDAIRGGLQVTDQDKEILAKALGKIHLFFTK